jgi:hypothetical protein
MNAAGRMLSLKTGDWNLSNSAQTSVPRAAGEGALLPIAFAGSLAGLAFLPPIRNSSNAMLATLAAAVALIGWNALLLELARRTGRTLTLEVILKKQHWVQACSQAAVLLYWGWYWPPVYAFAPFLLAQLLFAYAFDMLLGWSRRDNYTLGFAPFPVVFSINLFLWFKPDWFYLQFLLVAAGLAAKEFIRWNKEGRRVHIFNPSSFPLAIFSLVLLATGKSDLTWGLAIANTQFFPPQMFLFLFLVGLPGQFFFGVTSMTMSAVVTTYAFGRLYFAATGIYFFYGEYIPIAVFLGMHLLFTDPSTSPRTELGRIVYGALYGLSTVALYGFLRSAGMPTFYDKLLQVPLLNLSVEGIDRAARSRFLRALDPAALGRPLLPRLRNLAYMSVWAAVFAVLSAVGGVGDDHPGQWLPFWRKACQDGHANACPHFADMVTNFCNRGSGWACNQTGLLRMTLSRPGGDQPRFHPVAGFDPVAIARLLRHGCGLGFQAACRNLNALTSGAGGNGAFADPPPTLHDYPIILQGSKGEIRERDPAALYALACKQGWPGTCGQTAAAPGQ